MNQTLPEFERCGTTFTARRAGIALWQVELDFGPPAGSPFREEAVWLEAGVVAVGAERVVLLLELTTGLLCRRIEVPSRFGHFSVQRVGLEEWLFVLGWEDVHAFSANLEERWVARGIAVDGVTGGFVEGAVLHVNAEMDPPGGWVDVKLDLRTGESR